MLYLVIMLVMVSREMMTGAGIFVTFPVDTVENGRLVTVTGEVFRIDETEEYQTLYLKRVGISDGRQNIQERYFLAYVKGNHSFELGNKIKASGSQEFFENEIPALFPERSIIEHKESLPVSGPRRLNL